MQDYAIPLQALAIAGAEHIASNGRANSIIRSVMAWVSLASSSSLIWMIKRSQAGLTTTYHRILLGMSIADILYSIGLAHFNLTAPTDDDYYVWNAKGNQGTCSAQGFVMFMGSTLGLLYSCSLNLYCLATVKHEKTDSYIRAKFEPFFHGIPVAYAMATNIALLVKNNFNSGGGGVCYRPVYEPPHCIGYEDGQVREGFNIPCGRGRDGEVIFAYVNTVITIFFPPFIIGVSLWMIYRSVLQAERKIARYGAGALAANTGDVDEGADQSSSSSFCSRIRDRIVSATSCIKRGRSEGQAQPTSNQTHSNSRVVLHRAISYSIAFFLTWSFPIIGLGFDLAKKDWPTAIWYLSSIFNPLQGFFNFLIFMYPKVTRAKSRGGDNVSWCQAFVTVFLGRQTPNRVQQRRAPREQDGKKGEPKMDETKVGTTFTRATSPETEEEKTEIQAP